MKKKIELILKSSVLDDDNVSIEQPKILQAEFLADYNEYESTRKLTGLNISSFYAEVLDRLFNEIKLQVVLDQFDKNKK